MSSFLSYLLLDVAIIFALVILFYFLDKHFGKRYPEHPLDKFSRDKFNDIH
jgi:uncharacterized protein (UPF0333 family)